MTGLRKAPEARPCLFVYGSLRGRGRKPHPLLAPARRLGPAWVRGRRVAAGRWPGARPDPQRYLHGELWQLLAPRRSLHRLDRYENCRPGNPRLGRYSRRRVTAFTAQGECSAWIYWFRGPASRGAG